MNTREIAEQVVEQFASRGNAVTAWKELVTDVVCKALTGRDERAARIVETAAIIASPVGVIPQGDPEHERLARISEILTKAAAAIRAD